MRNLKMTIAYVGTAYSGWQIQPHRPTIQGVLEERLSRMLPDRPRLAGAGRTDAGVHARGQVANFATACAIPPAGLRRGLNAILPPDIAVLEVEEAPPEFHARANARAKDYRYRIVVGEVVSPFDAPFVLQVRGGLDVAAMRAAAGRLLGTHDFSSFCLAGTEVESRVRTLHLSEVAVEGPAIEYRVRGEGFLRHMVRTIVGTLVDVGKGRRRPEEIGAILAARDRRAAGPSAAARGLVLDRVIYGGDR
jgi:tRNA pseudouridine38-40 synthase